MATAKMSVADLERFLRAEFPQAFSNGDIKIESADVPIVFCANATMIECCGPVEPSRDLR